MTQGQIYKINSRRSEILTPNTLQEISIGYYGLIKGVYKNNNLDRAVSIHTIESLKDLESAIQPGDLGENLTLTGIPYKELRKGSRLVLKQVTLELTQQEIFPSNLIGLPYINGNPTKLLNVLKTIKGWYAKVIEPGTIKEKDNVLLV